MIDPPVRVRRFIHMHSLAGVRRVLKNNPDLLHNYDYTPGGKANTNLHLACLLNDIPICQFLLDLGHEDNGITFNALHETPLHIAAANGYVEIVNMLLSAGDKVAGVNKRDVEGRDAVMLAAMKGHDTVVQLLLTFAPIPKGPLPQYLNVKPFSNARPSTASSSNDPHHPENPARVLLTNQDYCGNTALHYACAYGQLLVQRTLLAAGANPIFKNGGSWEPLHYSVTASAEMYFKNLVAESERDYVAAKQSRARFAEMHAEKETGWPIPDQPTQPRPSLDQPSSIRTPKQSFESSRSMPAFSKTEQGLGLGMPDIAPMPDLTPLAPVSSVPPIPPMSRARGAAMGRVPMMGSSKTMSPGMAGGLRLVQQD